MRTFSTARDTIMHAHAHVQQSTAVPTAALTTTKIVTSVCGYRDVVSSHDSICVVLYHRDLDSLLVVRQFRPALYATLLRAAAEPAAPNGGRGEDEKVASVPLHRAFTCELCAGLIDKSKAVEEIVREEVLEECGFDVPTESIRRLTAYCAGEPTVAPCWPQSSRMSHALSPPSNVI
jgi:hypothetical protein